MKQLLLLTLSVLLFTDTQAQEHSVARRWNDVLLEAIRNDYARPTIHARNLFHTSIALYDGWAVFDPIAETYMLGKVVHDYDCPFNGIAYPTDVQAAQEEVMSYAAYRVLSSRFAGSPNAVQIQFRFDTLMANLGYNVNFTTTAYSNNSYAALGNYLAENILTYGFQDGSNEGEGYDNQYYQAYNPTLLPAFPGNPDILDPNRWQPLTLQVYIDQSGNLYPINTPEFLGPEWGSVQPFSLTANDLTVYNRDGFDYHIYHDPGTPPLMDTANVIGEALDYKWTFELVAAWSKHLAPEDTTIWDISPASIGNIQSYPTSFEDHPSFYDFENGGDISIGHALNPATGLPYAPQMVKRGDYARVLAEFWADGPDSETPPGHWFTLLNYVSDHPAVEKRYMGTGPVLSNLEWDVKSYFTLGGAVHDAAVTAWGVKGWYDYIRPISALRFMADLGQSTYPDSINYHPAGLDLVPDLIELVDSTEALVGNNYQHLGKVKLNVWKGPDYVGTPATDHAGVGWILAENWWPYQRPSFVTPPFAGYVSGHSTFSRAAAEVMTAFTGDAFFPGGMGEFHAPMDEFLVFENGPSEDIVLQWATYRDASDQCSLSRIWGGIHPPADDIPGRLMGIEVGMEAFDFARTYFEGLVTGVEEAAQQLVAVYPNPSHSGMVSLHIPFDAEDVTINVIDVEGRLLHTEQLSVHAKSDVVRLDLGQIATGMYFVSVVDGTTVTPAPLSIVR